MRDPLLAPLAAIALGILAARLVSFEPRELAAAILALLILAYLSWRRSAGRLALAGLMPALVSLGALQAVLRAPPPPPELDAGSREVVILEGCVAEPPVLYDDRQQFELELAPGARARVSLYLRDGQAPPSLAYGQRVELEARVRRPRNFGNPGSFDFQGYLARRGVFWLATAAPGAPVKALPGRCGSRFRAAILAVRETALRRIEQLYASDPYKTAMMQATLLGESSKLEKIWTENFRRTGTYHALVISGLHVAVLAAVLLFFLRLTPLPERWALLFTALAAWLYALVSGWQAPVIRAAGGFSLYLVARYFYRAGRVLNLLAAVAIAFLIFDPEQMFEASFQLSFLSVAAIGALAVPLLDATSGPLTRGLRYLDDPDRDPRLAPRVAQFRVELRLLSETFEYWVRLPRRWILAAMGVALRAAFFLFELAVVSCVVQFGLALPLLAYFHRVSISGLSANLLVVPLMSTAVPLGFLAIFTGSRWVGQVAGLLLDWSRAVVDWHARWEPQWRAPDVPLWLALAFLAALFALCLAVRAARYWRLALVPALGLFAAMLLYRRAPDVQPGRLELSMLDVGQGEALFLALPEGQTLLIDGGGIPTYGRRAKPRLDIGEDVVSPYLWSRSISRLDVVVSTHAHEDHMGGLAAVVRNFRPPVVWAASNTETRQWRAHTPVRTLAAGERFRLGGAEFEVLAPPPGQRPGAVPHNNDSLVLRVRFGDHAFLLTGDLEKSIETALLEDRSALRSQVLKVAHHGSRTSSSDPFLDAVRPAFALISAGFENPHGNPHRSVVERLERRGSRVLRTDQLGLLTVISDGRRLYLDTWEWSRRRPGLYEPF